MWELSSIQNSFQGHYILYNYEHKKLLKVVQQFCHITVTRRVWHVDQELLTQPEHLSSPSVFSGVHVSLCPFIPFSIGNCVVCSSLNYGFWLPLWYLQTFIKTKVKTIIETILSKAFWICKLICNVLQYMWF